MNHGQVDIGPVQVYMDTGFVDMDIHCRNIETVEVAIDMKRLI